MNRNRLTWTLFLGLVLLPAWAAAQTPDADLVLARLRYGGGGDWYNDPSSLPNLARFANAETRLRVAETEVRLAVDDPALFGHPIVFLTGHGRIAMTDGEVLALRRYLEAGGFLYADDDYGMDADFRALMARVFPDNPLEELPFSHGLYNCHFDFPDGLPKIHEHDNLPPRGYGLRDARGRLIVYYTVETNLADGWADAQAHGDPPQRREAALKMGVNILVWVLSH